MRVPLTCPTCSMSDRLGSRVTSYGEYKESNLYEVTCPEGHLTSILLQQQKFEVLFEIGVNAILDGYYREATTSFAASMERFHEYFIRAYFKQQGLLDASFRQLWAPLQNSSERQFGAYVALFTAASGQAPTLLSEANYAFRNRVVHKGIIPSRQESIDFGEACLAVLRRAIQTAKASLPEGTQQMLHEHLAKVDLFATDRRIATISMPTAVSLINRVPEVERLAEWLELAPTRVGRLPTN